MLFRLTHTAFVCFSSSYFCMVLHLENWFIHSPVDGFFHCFQFLVTINKASANIVKQVFMGIYTLFS